MPSQTIKQLYAGLLTNASAVLYTTPASTKALIKEIHLYNSGAAPNRVRFRRVGADADTNNFVDETMAAGATLNLPFNLVFVAAEVLRGFAGVTGEVHAVVSGIEIV